MGAEVSLVENALDTLDDVFYVYDEDGRLVHWNTVLAELFEYTDEELRGMAATEFFVPADQSAVEDAVAEVLETGQTVVEARAETTRGTVLFELAGQLLTDDEGNTIGFCGVGRDVTTVREREWQLQRQNERLGEFANVVAHDLRNPLQVAKLQLERIESATEAETVESVTEALDRMDRIVEDVLTLAREGQAVLDKQPVELAAVANAAWETVNAPDSRLVVRTDAVVQADESRLRRLFENCFRNAVEHGPAGDRWTVDEGDADSPVGVTITVEDTERGFAIEDDGVGFPPEIFPEAFEAGVSGSRSGTGFGLNIVRTLAEAHGWSVRAGRGTDGGARMEVAFDSLYARTPSADAGVERGE